MTTIHDQIDTLKQLYRRRLADHAFAAMWRFAIASQPAGWERALSGHANVFAYVAKLVYGTAGDDGEFQATHRARREFTPIDPSTLLVMAKREEIERVLSLTTVLYGPMAALWQRALLNKHYPVICVMTRAAQDRLAHLGVMPLIDVANLATTTGRDLDIEHRPLPLLLKVSDTFAAYEVVVPLWDTKLAGHSGDRLIGTVREAPEPTATGARWSKYSRHNSTGVHAFHAASDGLPIYATKELAAEALVSEHHT